MITYLISLVIPYKVREILRFAQNDNCYCHSERSDESLFGFYHR